MSGFDANAVLAGLKPFQRDAVHHVFERFYGDDAGSGRFLVADETGLGKSVVARGVVARAVEHLQNVDEVKRIDVVYMCSNADLARQNLARLNVTGADTAPLTTRLSLLALEVPRLRADEGSTEKKVNLVSFTPATSGFSVGGEPAGNARERALIAILLRELLTLNDDEWHATLRLFKRRVTSVERFHWRVLDVAREMGQRDGSDRPEPDLETLNGFRDALGQEALHEFRSVLALVTGHGADDRDFDSVWNRTGALLGRMRRALAKASLQALEPDLVILDEFQRFRELLDAPETSEAAELAHDLFSFPGVRVLLLSATPYKPFTQAGEAEDHHRDFMQTIGFLANRDPAITAQVTRVMTEYRACLVSGEDATSAARAVRMALLPVMSRSERPNVAGGFTPRMLSSAPPTTDDVLDFVALREFGDEVGAPIDLEYWKSIPYFANFMDGYKPGERARERFGTLEGARAQELLGRSRSLDRRDLDARREIDLGNGYLRTIAADTLGTGWSDLLWVPPSMPYLEPGGAYRTVQDVTKRVVFSAWSGVPTAVASLLSYEAERRASGAATRSANTDVMRLNYSLEQGRVGSLSTLALFFPHPALAEVGDPLAIARSFSPEAGVEAGRAEALVAERLDDSAQAGQPWEAFFARPTGLSEDFVGLVGEAIGGPSEDREEESEASNGLVRFVEAAIDRMVSDDPSRTHPELARFAMHAPGIIAYRAVSRIAPDTIAPATRWTAAFRIANGLRSLFNRAEVNAVLDARYSSDVPYWSAVLQYCADGNLQAVLDEYLFQLVSDLGTAELTADRLLDISQHAASVLSLRTVNYVGHDTDVDRTQIRIRSRFSLRYGGRTGTSAGDEQRQADVRAAFNSPFAPFVLVSTSVGQEGIDFHWWSHAVVHWNLPSNPVDFEQREGRVNRFGGHAIRRNVAAAHWADVVDSDDPNPWRAAFEAATRSTAAAEYGHFAPWWVYPGDASIQRIVMEHPLSRDRARYERLRDSLALYRLTLGQPRQEDMVELMKQRGVDGASVASIDLRPPSASA
ncbi:helicase-related protein [Curtobacterium sp. A7_M15]|uniref:helicase-related protein n=1 Tax=Curtobacterium sp. A7_M15 TaxID=3065241 RepID=UPI002737A7DA|nr:helicase-related protein [Curtobacterium sp. A7_M15]MDP4332142.1 helicase-related protein [Curtobacterium sp. A7_M15]